tara:strand:- start:1967 stop:2437 length:471 start_codon:yes stop_codon:yes gene_type:complete
MKIESQKLISGNIGMRYFAKHKSSHYNVDMLQITHVSMYAQTTDAVLADIDGVIVHFLKGIERPADVEVSFVAPKRTAGISYNAEYVKDLSDMNSKNLPVYVESDGGLYQVHLLSTSEIEVNNAMANDEGLALIDVIKATSETPEVFVVATTRRAH